MALFKRHPILKNISRTSSAIRDIEEVKQQYETVQPVSKGRPNNRDGKNGDKKVVQEGYEEFLYVKVKGKWVKTELQEVE
tara:strand:- start:206 stop:445 length:240 start_codon:yes stop_codon:yes gene_type:complete